LALVREPLVNGAESPALAAQHFDNIDKFVAVVALVAAGSGVGFIDERHRWPPLDCLTVAGAKKSSRALTTCGENRRRSDLATAASLKARLRGNDMVLRMVGSVGMGWAWF
jgi:hypothetical protein